MQRYYKVNTDTDIMKDNNFYLENISKFKKEGAQKIANLIGINRKFIEKNTLITSGIYFVGVAEKLYDLIDEDIRFVFKKKVGYMGNVKIHEFKTGSKLYKEYMRFCESQKDYQKLYDTYYSLVFWGTGKSSRACYYNCILLSTDGEVDENILSSLTEIKASEYYKIQEEMEN